MTMFTIRRVPLIANNLLAKQLHATRVCNTFWEKDAKGGYGGRMQRPPTMQMIRDGFKELKKEIELWTNEVKEHFDDDQLLIYRPGETDVVWRFSYPDSLQNWIVTSDSDHNEGFSKCKLELNQFSNAIFTGTLCTRVPKDGRIKRAGYCSIMTLPARKSFKREAYLDWSAYNTLVIKVRGDGRTYMINVATKGYFDILWNDMYNYVLHTRGGPYWQVTRIPFSKFIFSSKGRLQDKQHPIALSRITSFGLAAGDKIEGDFQLEIDYIGLEYDPNHTEEFAYEMYRTDKYIAAS